MRLSDISGPKKELFLEAGGRVLGELARLPLALTVHLQQLGREVDGGPVVSGRDELLQAPRVRGHSVRRQSVAFTGLVLSLPSTPINECIRIFLFTIFMTCK